MTDASKMRTIRRVEVRSKNPPGVAAQEIPVETGLRDRTWQIAEEWGKVGWPWFEALIKGAVALSKGEH